MDVEEMEAAIIRKVLVEPYSHAENILRHFARLERERGSAEAIEIIYHEIFEETSGSP